MSIAMAEWLPEVVVSPELALELVREQFPELGRTIEPFGSGWDNTAYLVDGDVVFRFPRRAFAVQFTSREVHVLPVLAPRLPLPIPFPRWAGAPTARFPWPFAGYRLIPGRTADEAVLSSAERRAAAPVLAEFLRVLHAIPCDGLGLPGDELARTDFVRRMPLLLERLEGLETAGIIPDRRPWTRLFEDFRPEPPPHPVPVHGDLYERHVLVDEANRVSGVIDWGDVHAGNPALDLSLLYRFFPADERDDFLRVYGPIDARTARMARLRAAFHASTLAFFAHSTVDAPLLRASLAGMHNVLEE
jgi:aminoglycoside phosphotransferase (APT) family kinase protein